MVTRTRPHAVAVYCRISKARKNRQGQEVVLDKLGVERQEKECRAWCEARRWKVAQVFTDNDRSAYRGQKRPGFDAMVEGIKSGAFDGVVAWHPDRLTRHNRELEDLIDLIEATGVTVGTVEAGEYDLTTPSGRMTARVVGATARYESEQKAARIRAKHRELAEAGKLANGGLRRFGYRQSFKPVDGEPKLVLTVDQREARLIREARDRVLAGEPVRAIARDWAARGVKRPSGEGELTAPSIKRVLVSPLIAGLRQHGGGPAVEAVWEPIISVEDHTRLVAVLTDPARRATHAATKYLLTGFVRCGKCGSKMAARPTARGVRKYNCPTGPGLPGCGGTMIGAQPVEDLIEQAVVERLSTPRVAKEVAVRRSAKRTAKKDPVVVLADLERRERELADAWAEGRLAKSMLERMGDALERDKAKAQRAISTEEVAKPVADLPSDPADLAKTWTKLSFDRKRAAFSALGMVVTIGPGRRGYNAFDSRRVTVTWKV
jgi:DNA invertase Pin-like site-specific DNA recombinase